MNRTEYIGKLNALYVGDKNCLEELITIYDEKDKEIERLNNIIKELEEYIVRKLKEFNSPEEYYTLKQIDNIHYRLQELKGDESNGR